MSRARRAAVVAVVAGLCVPGGAAVVIAQDGGPPPLQFQGPPVPDQNFVAVAVGLSRAELVENGARLLIDLDFVNAPYGLSELKVDKMLDVTQTPPVVDDSTYTLTATNGDRLVLDTQGIATDKRQAPDKVFDGANEEWTVLRGSGRFEGASGQGKVISAVVLDVRGRGVSPVQKYFVGRLDLRGG